MTIPDRDDATLPNLLPPRDSEAPVPELDIAARTDVGKVRERNEDQFLIAHLERSVSVVSASVGAAHELRRRQGTLLVVADGMGGHGGGDVASAVTLDSVVQHALTEMPWICGGSAEADALLAADLQRLVIACQERLWAVAERKHLPPKLGTTLTTGYLRGGRLIVAHVGDSRAYLMRAGVLKRLTKDHTLGAALGQDQEGDNRSHVLLNAIGGSTEQPRPELSSVQLVAGDRILLCSDGLHGTLDDARITELLAAAKSAREAVDVLVKETLARGAPDNVTVVAAYG